MSLEAFLWFLGGKAQFKRHDLCGNIASHDITAVQKDVMPDILTPRRFAEKR